MARPTNYDKKYIKKVKTYLKNCKDEEIKFVKQENGEKGYRTYDNKLKVNLPTIEGFANYIKVPKSTLYDWKDEHKELSDSLEDILVEQQKRLLNMGLSGEYNSTIAKLILSSNHGMREKTDVDVTSKGEVVRGFNFIKPEDEENNTDNKTTT